MQFYWYEPVLYYVKDHSFPTSRELPGHFVGIAEHCGDALTYCILVPETGAVIHRSVVRSAGDPNHPNLRQDFAHAGGEPGHRFLSSESDIIDPARLKLPEVDPDELNDLIGRHFVKRLPGKPVQSGSVRIT